MPFPGFPISRGSHESELLERPFTPPGNSVSLPQIDAAWPQVLSVVRVKEISEGRSLHLKLVSHGSKVML